MWVANAAEWTEVAELVGPVVQRFQRPQEPGSGQPFQGPWTRICV